MITLKTWLETVNYRITEGSNYTWSCYGSDAHTFDSWNGDHNGSSFNITFDTKTQEVYEVAAHDYRNNRAYRMINPDYVAAYRAECEQHDSGDEAWENVRYVDLDVEADWVEKAQAIYANQDYDARVQIPIDFSDEELLVYMKMAHERDMTFNAFVEEALREAIAREIPTLYDVV